MTIHRSILLRQEPIKKASVRSVSAFTMIEIALSLAVIAFALIAIIGVLPHGLRVQKDNRQETIINQDAVYLMEVIRSGTRGLHDLTNYVDRIVTNGVAVNRIVSGEQIVGLLSRPKYYNDITNTTVAYIRAISGNASEKPPQTNEFIRDLAFTYRLNAEVLPLVAPTNVFNNLLMHNLQTNLYELRLTFRWPVLPSGGVGGGKLTFRTLVAGYLQPDGSALPGQELFFLKPGAFLHTTNASPLL